MGYLDWKSGKEQEAIRDLELVFELQKKAGLAKNSSSTESLECDLFINWLTNNLTASRKYDIRVAMPDMYRKFDQYLKVMRGQLNRD